MTAETSSQAYNRAAVQRRTTAVAMGAVVPTTAAMGASFAGSAVLAEDITGSVILA
ncbi:MAG: MFS transporter, partial [Acidimicrobiaceae bacterium]|nr:MFS transporter [Acidimicrobiaceae bacterium]